MSDQIPAPETRCGFIAVIGAPNAGKSTLVNTLVGAKVSIVSRKVQTTRMPVRGIAVEGASQLVFIDTPGIFAPRRRLDRAMVDAAWGGAGDADAIVLLIDAAKGLDEEAERILNRLEKTRAPLLLVLNKIDRVKKERLLDLARQCNGSPVQSTFTPVTGTRRVQQVGLHHHRPAGTVGLPAGRDLGCALAVAGGGDHAREGLGPPARRAPL
jgi:GTP-binding protein Era